MRPVDAVLGGDKLAEVKWIKIVTDVFDDQKIRFIETLPNGDAIIVIWFKILCLAGKSNSNGFLMMTEKIPYTDDILASIFDRDIKLIQLSLATFEKLDMIEIIDNKIYLSNWEKHQNSERLEEIREQGRLRQERYRKKLECNANSVTPALQERYGNAVDIDKDIEEDIKREYREKAPEKPAHRSTSFKPPTIDEIQSYCQERKNSVSPERFHDFYAAKGWMVGKNKMKDWKACVRTWEQRDKQDSPPTKETTYDISEYEKSGVFDSFDRK